MHSAWGGRSDGEMGSQCTSRRVAGKPQPPYQQLVWLSLVTQHGGYMPDAPKLQYVGERAAVEASTQSRMGGRGEVLTSGPAAWLQRKFNGQRSPAWRYREPGTQGSRCKPTGGGSCRGTLLHRAALLSTAATYVPSATNLPTGVGRHLAIHSIQSPTYETLAGNSKGSTKRSTNGRRPASQGHQTANHWTF